MLLCLVGLSISLEFCVYRHKFYISSKGQDSEKCLKPGQSDYPCASIAFLSDHVHNCATFEIMDDLILLNTILSFDSLWANISFLGANNSGYGVTIECKGNSGFLFNSSSGFDLKLLNFKNCAYEMPPLKVNNRYPGLNPSSVLVHNCSGVYITNCSFQNNIGSAILLVDVLGNIKIDKSCFRGNELQLNSSKSRKGGIVLRASPTSDWIGPISITSCHFISNHNANTSTCSDAEIELCHRYNGCGGAIDILQTIENMHFYMYILIKGCVFIDNQAAAGGAISIYAGGSTHVAIVDSIFTGNKGFCLGGAVVFKFDGCHGELRDTNSGATDSELQDEGLVILGSRFERNSAFWGGGLAAASTLCDSCNSTAVAKVNLTSTYWIKNTAWGAGFAIGIRGPILYTGLNCLSRTISVWLTDCSFDQNYNTGDSFGAMSAEKASVTFQSSYVNFTRNNGTALALTDSTVDIICSVRFEKNYGIIGGAVYMEGESYFNIDSYLSTLYVQNMASVIGGAIYSSVFSHCTFVMNSICDMQFLDNYAQFFEQSVYIENIGTCGQNNKAFLDCYGYSLANTDILFPLYHINFSLKTKSNKIMLGEEFHLELLNMTDIFGQQTVGIGYIRVHCTSNKASLKEDYRIRGPQTVNLDNYTDSIKFLMYGPEVQHETNVTIEIYFERHIPFGLGLAELNLSLVHCRMGYKYSVKDNICVCVCQTNKYVQCSLQNISIKRHYWYSSQLMTTYPCPQLNCLYVSDYCPSHSSDNSSKSLDYCSIQSPVDVCSHGRSGFLCYNCANNYSFTFGALKCTTEECDVWSALKVSGLLLAYWTLLTAVILLIAFSKGNVNLGFMFGIMHYFSVAVLYTKSSELFSEEWMQVIMYIATAITSLNPEIFGLIDVCFAERWTSNLPHELFRFLTPILVGLVLFFIFFIFHHSRNPRCKSLAEKSTAFAVCLFILFSYTPITNTSLKLLLPMKVNGRFVAQVAPTIPYFHKENMPYATIAICVEVLLSFPLCFLLLLSPAINRCIKSEKNRLKLILNEFGACYKPGYQWFAGFYFLSRQVLFILNSTNSGPFPNSNIIMTTANIIVLIVHASSQPYSLEWLNILDTVLLTDLVVMSLSSPFKMTFSNLANNFFYNTLIPYSLILMPTACLLLVIIAVCKKSVFK